MGKSPRQAARGLILKYFYSLAHKILRDSKSSTRAAGFGATNALMAEIVTHLMNLATNTANNRTTIK